MKKIKYFRNILNEELPKHKTNEKAFESANKIFEEKTGIDGYSSYRSYLTVVKNAKD